MIPKVIHYCWFGNGPKGEKEEKCIASWKKFCPDYEIIEWNESNVDLNIMPFVKDAYDAKKYAFVSDVIRLWAVYTYGGIYFDTDVELVKCYDDLLDCKGFMGFENSDFAASGLGFGAEKGNPIIKEMLEYYRDLSFDNSALGVLSCPKINTAVLENHGLVKNGQYQNLDGFAVYPTDYFNPYDSVVDKLSKTPNTYSIHWYSYSWGKQRNRLMKIALKYYHRIQKKMGKI